MTNIEPKPSAAVDEIVERVVAEDADSNVILQGEELEAFKERTEHAARNILNRLTAADLIALLEEKTGKEVHLYGDLEVRHKKHGTDYKVVLSRAKLRSAIAPSDNATLVIYEGPAGFFWARPAVEFFDGRFETIEKGKADE